MRTRRCGVFQVLIVSWAVIAPWSAVAAPAQPKVAPPAATGSAALKPAATTDAPPVPENIRELMQDRKYAEAVKAIDTALQAMNAPRDYLSWLRGRALHLAGQHDEAIAVFEGMERTFPQSPWIRRARFSRAITLARKGDFRAAELIYRTEAEYLLSADRKQQIADLYLEFADAFFKPPKEEQKPDYAKALEFYKKALEVGPKPEKQAEVELLVAQCHQKLSKFDEAIGLYEQFVKRHPASPLDIEARYDLGACHLAKGNGKLARRVWQDLLAKYPDLRSERIAQTSFNLSRTWGIPPVESSAEDLAAPPQAAQPPAPAQQAPSKPAEAAPGEAGARGSAGPASIAADGNEAMSLGVAALEAFIEKFPAHKLASRAHMDIAVSYVHFGRYEAAVKSLQRFLADERYRDREEVPAARYLLGKSYRLQKNFPEALRVWQEYLVKHPTHKRWSDVQREVIDTEFLMAKEQLDAKQYAEAIKLWNAFLAKYPLDGRNPEILYWFGAINFQQEKWEAAIADWRRLVSKYPGDDWASRAQLMIAVTLEQKLAKLEEALDEYKKVASGSHAAEAQRAIARLTAKRLTVATERVFRSDETPKLALTTRNVESVTVRAYKVDMETYFRKMHLARGVEGLDIALISPDKTFEFAVPKYVKHQEQESQVEVPLPQGREGVMAVTVSSKTHEATTLLIQSDLDVIVKSSRNEVFVFAENMRTGKPWPEVKLLISNGKQVFAEGVTGKDGVFRGEFKELKDAGDVRVFAIAGGSVASNLVGLQGVGVAQGLADKGYLYSDRPAYRAGQIVHLRGCVRLAANDAYLIDRDKKYTLEVFDSRNRVVRQEKVALSEFGTFHAHFNLPESSPQGQYRFLIRDEAGKSFGGTFVVHEFALEPVRLAVDTPRRVYYRGEEIEGTIRAAFYYGAPLAGREIRYQLADDRQHTATTDAKGEVRFKLPTREFSETQVLPLVVTLPERNLQSAVNFLLATRGFAIEVSSVRPVYVAGETFEVSIKTRDAEGKPIAKKLALSVLEKTVVEGKVGERLAEKHDVETAADGTARQTLKLDKGGRYVVRLEGSDQFKNPISGEHAVQVSGEEDEVRLRILSDKHTYKVGDAASVQLYWREEPALALIAFQGARILDYRLVELQKGSNKLEIPMTARLAPNFELAVAVMTDSRRPPAPAAAPAAGPAAALQPESKKAVRRFHAASSPFTVERDLRVSIVTKRKGDATGPIRPGEPLEVTLTTTDPQGRPVATELSLALVEQSLLERFAWQVPAIQEFFRGTRGAPAVRTTASIAFEYRPATRPINPQLLAEADRLEVAREEEASRRLAGEERLLAAGEHLARSRAEATSRTDEIEQVADTPALVTGNSGIAFSADGASLGRSTQSLRMMVTPGQVMQEEASQERVVEQLQQAQQQVVAGVRVQQRGQQLRSGGFGFGRAQGRVANQVEFYDDSSIAFPDAQAWGNLSARRVERYRSMDLAKGGAYFNAPANVELLTETLALHNRRTATVLDANGRMQEWEVALGDGVDPKAVEAAAVELNKIGAVLLAGQGPQETGYWNPAIVTDKEGKATLSVTVPERTTAWQWMAKGITAETLAGEATGDVVVKKDLFGELKLPQAFTDGDDAEVLVSVHNDAVEKGPIEVTLKTTVAGRSTEEKKTVTAAAKGLHELAFKVALRRPEPAKDQPAGPQPPDVAAAFELSVAAGAARDVSRRSVPLLPYGMPVYATASGSATSDTTAWVEPPPKMPLNGPNPAGASGFNGSLQILVGPTVERSLLDIVLGPAPSCQMEFLRFASGLDTATSDLLAAIGLQKLMAGTREAGGPQAQAIDARIRGSVSLLVASQRDDGGWSWASGSGNSDRYISARAVWALALARAAGQPVPDDCYNKALGYLRNQMAATDNADYESKAILLHAMSAAGQGDFAVANRLYRERPQLSAAALAQLALAMVEMDRKQTAGELLALLAQKNLDDAALKRQAAHGSLPWSHSPAELRGLFALALQRVTPKDPRAKELVDWLLAHRTGYRWAPDKATGPAALALCEWFAQSRFQGEHYTLTVFVNDVQAKVLEVTDATATQVIDVPAKLLKPGKQRVNFQITGRGRYTYQCVLGGFVAADKLAATTHDWRVERRYDPAPLEMDGREIPRGYDVLEGSYSEVRNPFTQLPLGRRGLVTLELWRNNVSSNTPEEQLEYLVITEPIPSGATVAEKSVQGGFERFEIGPGAITFYVGTRRYPGQIRYELVGYAPGSYRAAPTVVRNAYRPEQLVVSGPKPLAVLAAGEKSADAYQLTPKELFELGKLLFAKSDWKGTQQNLTELVEKWNLRAEVYKESVGMLLDSHLETGPPAKVVRYFEIIKEKWPAQEIPFAKIVKVGAAYHEMGEYERSYLIFRATVESSFGRESNVAGFLEGQGEFLRGVEVMGRLLREYPPEAYVAAASYALAQRVYAKAPEAAADAKLREKKVNRVDLVRRAWAMLEDFLTAYPDDPAADQAAFATANAVLELKLYAQAAALCNRYATRYPKSELLPSFWYIIGYCYFATGRHEQALEMCRKVAEAKWVDPKTGVEKENPNKWRAVYILGQVFHSLGEAAKAVAEYRRVEDRFADAKEAILYFLRKAIELPEVTTVKPGAAAEVELKFRNIASADVKVYAIDLMKFSLLKRNLDQITHINLAGIRPYHEATLKLGDGKDYRDRTEKVPLPLKEEGAYLVVCRGEDLHASGLVLVTPLGVDVQEDRVSGRVRTTVKDVTASRYVNDVHVKVIGSQNADFVSGSTDLRGVFVADGIRGKSTVIAQVQPSRYAFYRGQTDLVSPPPAPAAPADAKVEGKRSGAMPAPAASLEKQLLEGIQYENTTMQRKQVEQLKQIQDRPQKGVEAQRAY